MGGRSAGSLDLFVESHFIELGTELHDLQPLGGVPSVLLGRVARNAW